jgi:hypothetical protein
MKMPSKSELMHLKIQAAMRENIFDEDQMKYLGLREDGKYWYLVAGEYEVSVDQFEEFDMIDNGEEYESV